MKLGCVYTVFNACELLAGSIAQIYNQVDEIVIINQKLSNRGNKQSKEDALHIMNLLDKKKIHLIEFIPDLNLNTKENELNKHNQAIEYMKTLKCSHFMMSATDHFYDKHQFALAKIKAVKYDVTLTKMFTYYKKPTLQLVPIEEYFMTFICKLHNNTRFTPEQWKYKVDPALRLNTKDSMYLFEEGEIMMHHYSMIRNDISNKFNNAAASVNWMQKIPAFIEEYNNAKAGDKISYFGGRELIEVKNYFKIK